MSAIGLLAAALGLAVSSAFAATNDLTSAIQRGLFEEEANQNLGAAIQAYQTVASQFDKDRKLAATAIFRLGECYRKQGNTNAAAEQYERVLREFSDQPTLVTLSRQNLASLGSAPPGPVTPVVSEVEALALENQLAVLTNLPPAERRMAVRQNFTNPVLTSLMQKLAEAEQNLATAKKEYGPQHMEVQKATVLVETINRQIDEQVDGVLQGLKAQAAAERRTAEMLGGQTARVVGKEASASTPASAATSRDADEVKRIQTLIKDSPDLINAPDGVGETLLDTAAAKGNMGVVKLLLDSGAAVDGLQQPGLTALHYAAGNGHKAAVDLLLSKGAKPDTRTEGGVTALHLAARNGYESVVKALLAAGAPVNAKNTKQEDHPAPLGYLHYRLAHSGQTPLHLAASAGFTGVVELLLAKGADADAVDDPGRTPLSYAVEGHYQLVVQLLLAAHANPNSGSCDLPLTEAAYYGDMPALKLLLANGADPNISTNLQGNFGGVYGSSAFGGGNVTPLAAAVSRQHPEAVAELIRAKADPNGSSPDGTPLVFPALGDVPTLKALLEGGADPNRPGRQGASPLYQAVMEDKPAAVEVLLAYKADVNAGRTDNGYTPLQIAADRAYKPAAELLLKAGADVNAVNKDGWVALCLAVMQKHLEMAQLLLAHNADPNARDKDGQTPLYHAVMDGQREMAELLLANKADPNAKDKNGETPLHVAVSRGQKEIAELLLANKADPNERDNSGRTPLDLAKNMVQQGQPGRPGRVPSYPGQPFSASTTAREQESKPETMADLLRRHGALDDLPHLDRIGVRRTTVGYCETAFAKPAQDWSHFTLLELIAVQYSFLASSPNDGGGESYSASAFVHTFSRLPFPDLAHLHISRPARDLKSWHDEVVDLTPVIESGDRAKDVRLEWGDMVEIPEADHPLYEKWDGFSRAEMGNLKKCLTRKVEIVVKGQVTPVTLAPKISGLEETPGYPGWQPSVTMDTNVLGLGKATVEPTITARVPFWLMSVLLQSRLVLISSDLSRVKVTRRDSATGQERKWVVDCSKAGESAPDLWLENGDRIEVPEKTYASAAAEAEVPPSAPGQAVLPSAPGASARSTFAQRLNKVPQLAAAGPQAKPLLFEALADAPTLKKLLEGGADPNVRTSDGTPLLVQAVRDRNQLAVELLLSHHAQVDAANSDGWTPLDYAVADGLKAIVELLLKAGATVNARNPSGDTPLHIALRGGQRELAELLLAHKADPNVRNNAGETPLALTQTMGLFLGMGGAAPLAPPSETPPAVEEEYPNIGGVLYSPKPNDPELLNAGYHRDRSARTRKAECWELRAKADLSGRGGNTIWTGTDMIEFGGEGMGTSFGDGARYCFAENTWAALPQKGEPSSRSGHAMVWTGKEMIVWGGFGGVWGNDTIHDDGARYNPSGDTWKPMTTKNAPSARVDFPAVWTGREMLLWGGFTDTHSRYQGYHAHAQLNTGGRYAPSSDSWKSITAAGAPSKRCCHTLVWTGKEAIVWGGCNATRALNDGARYNPSHDSWKPISADGAPSPRLGHVAFWTGKEMIVWGGTTRETDTQGTYFENGARYDPQMDTWRPMSTLGAPKGRVIGTAVWTGTEMIVWGGANDAQAQEGAAGFDPNRYIGTGARYNPATDTWTEMTLNGAPSPRVAPSGVWTGEGLLFFGGYNGTHFNDTWFYSPARTLYPYAKG